MRGDPESTLGVALTRCYFCNEADRIVMNSRLTKKLARQVEECNGKVLDLEPCPKCKGYMEQGIILLTFDPARSEPDWHKQRVPNPYRTGGFFVVRAEAIPRILGDSPLALYALTHRWIFIEHEAAKQIGLFDTPPQQELAP